MPVRRTSSGLLPILSVITIYHSPMSGKHSTRLIGAVPRKENQGWGHNAKICLSRARELGRSLDLRRCNGSRHPRALAKRRQCGQRFAICCDRGLFRQRDFSISDGRRGRPRNVRIGCNDLQWSVPFRRYVSGHKGELRKWDATVFWRPNSNDESEYD